MDYVRDYIKTALETDSQLPEPDRARANGTYEALSALHYAHRSGGAPAAKLAWLTIKQMQPHLAEFEQAPLLIHADDLAGLSEPTYLLDDFAIYHKAFNVLVGPSGCGKSFTALKIAGNVATHGTVVYIAGEGLNGYNARWQAWKEFHQVDYADLWFYREALQIMNEKELIDFVGMLQDLHAPQLVIIDTLARSAVGIDENSATEMGKFVQACARLQTVLDCAVLVVHHTGKNGVIRGSSALYGASDSVIAQTMTDELITITNNPEKGGKNKYSEAMEDKHYRIMPMTTTTGINGAVLVPAEKMVTDIETDRLTSSQRQILEALDGYEEEGLTPAQISSMSSLSNATVYRQLKKLKKADYVRFENERYYITGDGQGAL